MNLYGVIFKPLIEVWSKEYLSKVSISIALIMPQVVSSLMVSSPPLNSFSNSIMVMIYQSLITVPMRKRFKICKTKSSS